MRTLAIALLMAAFAITGVASGCKHASSGCSTCSQ